MSRLDQVRAKRPAILAIAARHGARNVRVFGSVARGSDTAASDLDFLVDLEPGRSLFDLGALWVELQDLFEQPVDVAAASALPPRARARALAEAVAV